jgi:acetylornithine/N-succinyldiaminopimelate aminotransferase
MAKANNIMNTYRPLKISLESGNGCYVYDENNKKYLDMCGALATCPLGHANPALVTAISEQAEKIICTTNLYLNCKQQELAKKLVHISSLKSGKCFFSNSGTEANEAAIKLARKYTGKKEIIACEGAFHGRTLGSLSATWKKEYKDKFMPLVPGFKHIPYNDIKALEDAIGTDTAAFIVEPIQGEAGIIVPSEHYLKKAAKICKEKKILLIVDEIQTGIGRTGEFFAYQKSKIMPDIVTIAKGLANGIPIGATIAKEKVAMAFEPGDHGSTFGGNQLSCAAALATIQYIEKHDLVKNAEIIGNYIISKIKSLAKLKKAKIKEVRGSGLMIGIELEIKEDGLAKKFADNGVLVSSINDTIIRILPPLILNKKEADQFIAALEKTLE